MKGILFRTERVQKEKGDPFNLIERERLWRRVFLSENGRTYGEGYSFPLEVGWRRLFLSVNGWMEKVIPFRVS